MTPPAARRRILVAAGIAAISAVGGTVLGGTAVAQPEGIFGEVTYEGGSPIPEGEIRIHLEGPAIEGHAGPGSAITRISSDGKSTVIGFALPGGADAAGTLEIVARLERSDGWLLARGSAVFQTTDPPVSITLNAAIY